MLQALSPEYAVEDAALADEVAAYTRDLLSGGAGDGTTLVSRLITLLSQPPPQPAALSAVVTQPPPTPGFQGFPGTPGALGTMGTTFPGQNNAPPLTPGAELIAPGLAAGAVGVRSAAAGGPLDLILDGRGRPGRRAEWIAQERKVRR